MNAAAPQPTPIHDSHRSAIPEELLSRPQWIAWWSIIGEGRRVKLPNGSLTGVLKKQPKPHKLPINPHTGGLASTTRPATWASFADARAAVRKWSLSGVGFVFTDSDPYGGLDLDNCRDPKTEEIVGWAWEIIRALNSYTEVSPSGTGVHTIVRGKLPAGRGNQFALNGGKVELFSRARYFTFTGKHLDGTPTEIFDRQAELTALHDELFRSRKPDPVKKHSSPLSLLRVSNEELIAKAKRARNGSKFDSLWRGLWEGEYISQSEADLALCGLLAFWTGGDLARIDSLFRQSGLMRDKWNREDYGRQTIERALSTIGGTYKSNGQILVNPDAVLSPPGADHGSADERVETPDLLGFPYTDTGNAERLVCLYRSEIRFCPEMRKWFVWDGRRWSCGDTRRPRQLFKKTMREMYRQAADILIEDKRTAAEKHARKSEAAAAIWAALECAECEEEITASASDFDKHPYLLNCENGTLDLNTGRLRAHDRQDLITKLVHVEYHADATCPQFLRFIMRIMGETADADQSERGQRLVIYVQKCFGYALTSDVSEKCVFCFFGSGNNGKTTLLEVIRFILTEYSAQVLIDSLMSHKSRESNASLADLAELRGARFVTTSEPEQGQRLAIGKLKYLTQGMGEIKACRKYENPITFVATHKLFLDANHRPLIIGAERAIWNRLKPIPFLVEIPPTEIDKCLLEKLKDEAEGILAWMVEGYRLWKREGLGDHPEITAAAALWQAESDTIAAFLEERCVFKLNDWVPVKELWGAYSSWCQANNEEPLAKSVFDATLEDRGCRRRSRKNGTVRGWIGLRLRNP